MNRLRLLLGHWCLARARRAELRAGQARAAAHDMVRVELRRAARLKLRAEKFFKAVKGGSS